MGSVASLDDGNRRVYDALLEASRRGAFGERRSIDGPVRTPWSLFPALCAIGPRRPTGSNRSPLVYSPPRRDRPAPLGILTDHVRLTTPGRSRLSLPEHQDAAPAWSRLSDELRGRVGESAFEIWLAPLRPAAFTGELLTLIAPPDTAGWLTGRYGPVIAAAACAALGDGTRVVIDGHPATTAAGAQPAPQDPSAQDPRRSTGDGTCRTIPQPSLPVRAVHHRPRQPSGSRRRARRRREPGPGLQPAVPVRTARDGQDPSAARDRQLRMADLQPRAL